MKLTFRMSRRSVLGMTLASAVALGTLPARAEPVTIDFWDMIWGGPDYPVAGQALVDQFNAEQDEIQVVYRSVPWTNWYETFVTAIASGSAPDLSTGAAFQSVQFYGEGAILPVDELVEEFKTEGTADDFAEGTLDTLLYDGHYVGLPFGMDVRVLFYRKDILEAAGVEPPTTWEEFRAAAKATTTDGVYGLVSSGDSGGVHWAYYAIINNGGGMFATDYKADLTSDRSKGALQFLADLVADGSVNPASAGNSSDDARASFFRGEAAFLLASPGVANAGGDARDQIGILAPIAGPHGDKGTVYWPNNTMVYSQTEHPEETFKFLKWWSVNSRTLWTEGDAGPLPARLSFAADPYFQDDDILKFTLDEYVPIMKTMGAKAEGVFPAMNEADGEGFMQTLIQQIWQGRAVDDVLPAAQQRLEEIMAKYGI